MRHPRAFMGGVGNNLFQFFYLYAQARKHEIPDVYLQDPQYFDEFREEIQTLLMQDVEPIDMVAMHVRRGPNPSVPEEPTYADNSFYVNLCNTSYYEDAMAEFPNKKFLIFTDDKEFCKLNFPGIQMYEGKSDVEEWNAMTGCTEGIITANSSFSWWSAYANSDRPVVAPKAWYSDGVERTKLLDNWKTV